MPININEDRRLRVAWLKYQNIINDMNKYLHKKKFIQNEIDVNNMSRWEAGLAFDEEIKKIEQQRREEMNVIRKQARAEKKQQEEDEMRKKDAALEERRIKREMRKKTQSELSPPPLRRYARVHKKTSNNPLSMY